LAGCFSYGKANRLSACVTLYKKIVEVMSITFTQKKLIQNFNVQSMKNDEMLKISRVLFNSKVSLDLLHPSESFSKIKFKGYSSFDICPFGKSVLLFFLCNQEKEPKGYFNSSK